MRSRSSTATRLLKVITGISVMTMCAASSVFAAAPYTTTLPDFSKEVLTPVSQAATAWTNKIPNALADYFTYVPYSDAIVAGHAGFPASLKCGDTTANGGSDCYTITVKQSAQAMALPGIFGGGAGLLGADGSTSTGILPTTFWGYGSGGAGWLPPGGDGTAILGNAPTPFADGTYASAGIWHFPAPTIKGTKGRPVHVRWVNELPNTRPQGHDPSVDCGSVAEFCYPYNRIVTHVHGAHVLPQSDGLATAWYTPSLQFGEGQFSPSLYENTTGAGGPIYSYPMDQEAGTIWYHDHAVGTTHLNTNMGMAGFFPITDDNEKALQTDGVADNPATPLVNEFVPPTLPSGAYELGFALQDRHFDVTGQMVMPDYGIYDRSGTSGPCTLDAITGLPVPGSCPRLHWMKAADGHLIPYNSADTVTLAQTNNNPPGCTQNFNNPYEGISGYDATTGAPITFTQCAPFPATSATLEYIGNMPVVNGVTYGVYDVEPTVYRIRFIGGTDSRTFILQLVDSTTTPTTDDCTGPVGAGACKIYTTAASFWQIGSEQGLLTNPVSRDYLDIMGGERYDVLVDFSGLAGKTISVKNLGDDAPYSGRFDFENLATRQPTSVDIPEVMRFRVAATAPALASAKTPVGTTTLRAAYAFPPAAVDKTSVPRVISLMEITDQYGRTMPTIDARGYIQPGIRTTEIIKQGDLEQWDIVNSTVDAHPMHIHQVAFQGINRQALQFGLDPTGVLTVVDSATGFRAPANFPVTTPLPNGDRAAGVFAPVQYVPDSTAGSIHTVPAFEQGWKDTIQCPPGYVTRVRAYFDLLGDYVWHCHILSHEEHDMMRPFRVVQNQLATPASLALVPAGGSVTVTVAPVTGAVQYIVQYRKLGEPFWNTNNAKTATQTISVVASGTGTYEFRAQVVDPAVQSSTTTLADSGWVSGQIVVNVPMAITSPNGGESLPGFSTYNVTWTPQTGANNYILYYSATGAAPWTVVAPVGNVTSYNWTVPNVSTTTARFRIHAFNGATWLSTDVSDANFTMTTSPIPGAITSPNGGETLAGFSVQTVTWNPQAGANNHILYYSATGAAPWTYVANVGNVTSYNWTVPNVSTTTARFRKHAFNGSTWLSTDVSDADFTITTSPITGTITSPNGGETLSGLSVQTVTWIPKAGANNYILYYSATGAAPWTAVASVGNVSSYNWTVPSVSTTTARFRIHAFNGATWLSTDISDADFTITP